jgi:hypothetical protein
MYKKCTFFFLSFFLLFLSSDLLAQQYKFEGNWGQQGMTVEKSTNTSVRVNFSVTEFSLEDIEVEGKMLKSVYMPEVFLPNNAGSPNLPGTGRYIAVPNGATVQLKILEMRTEIFKDIDIAPAPVIPFETEDGPLKYIKDPQLYSKNEFYPSKFVQLSEQTVYAVLMHYFGELHLSSIILLQKNLLSIKI